MIKTIFKKPILIIASIVAIFFAGLFFIFESTPKTQAAPIPIVSLKDGSWSDLSVWGGQVPGPADEVIIQSHAITYDTVSAKVATLTVNAGGQLIFDPSKSATLESNGNVVINGTLVMKPSSAASTHTLRFTGANENAFGDDGSMDVERDDVGLWVMGGGKLDVQGAQRTGWARATNSLIAGGTLVVLDQAPVGWLAGDEVLVVPTAKGAIDAGEVRTISEDVTGNTVKLSSPLSNSHPTVSLPDGRTLGAEVANLTRNVRIEGMPPAFPFPTSTQNNSPGRSHIFIRNTSPVVHTIKYAAIRYMGPRKFHFKPESTRGTDFVVGRYALHFHMSGENNHLRDNMGNEIQRTIVEGVVARDIGSHAFVPHASHGITFRDTVSYNTGDEPYWWDPRPDGLGRGVPNPNASNDILYDHALAAYVNPDPANLPRHTSLSAFLLDEGLRNTIRNSVAVAVHGGKNSSGYHWPERANSGDNVWTFENNLVHNNQMNGIFTWQNTPNHHIVAGITAYHNLGAGIDHGAYVNLYNYSDAVLFENGLAERVQTSAELQLHSNGAQKFNNFRIGTSAPIALELLQAGLPSDDFVELKNWNITKLGVGNKAVRIGDENLNPDKTTGHKLNIICWTLPGGAELEQSNFDVVSWEPNTTIRVRRQNGTAYQFKNGVFTDTVDNIASLAACDSAPEPPPPPPPTLKSRGDLDGDGKIGILDITRLFTKWGSTVLADLAEADINPGPGGVSLGRIDIYDANKLMANWTIASTSSAVTASHLTSGRFNGPGGGGASQATTASVAIGANKLALIWVAQENGQGGTPTLSDPNRTWTQIATNGLLRRISLYRSMNTGVTTGAITVSSPASPQTNANSLAWSLVEYSNVNTSGTNGSGAIAQFASRNYAEAGTGLSNYASVNLAASAITNSAVAGGFAMGDSGLPLVAGPGYTLIGTSGCTFVLCVQAELRNTFSQLVDMSWTGVPAHWLVIGAELKAATP